jgi:hypothetical protein
LPASVAFIVAMLLGGAAAGCSPRPPGPVDACGSWSTHTLDDHQVTLSVPRSWNVGTAWTLPGSFTDLTGSFSNQSLSPPCVTGPNTVGCGPPLRSLQPGAMLVEVWQNGSPQWTLDDQAGAPAVVSGLPAKLDVEAGGAGYCSGMGADRTRIEYIPFPTVSDNYVEIDICSRGVADDVGARVIRSVSMSPID